MSELTKKVLIAVMSIALVLATGCSDKSKKEETPKNETTAEEKQNTSFETTEQEAVQEKHSDNEVYKGDNGNGYSETTEQEAVKGKYSDNEVYKGNNGNDYSKTEDGTEVEITGDNFQKLMEEYEKVKGTGSEREKELLDQIQVIMDIVSNQSVE